MEETECSEMSAYIIQMPGNHPKESIQQKDSSDVASNEKHGGSLSQPVLFDCTH
jgi:hypothetical protein